MKTLLIAIIAAASFCFTKKDKKPDKILLIIDQNPASRPIAKELQYFWDDPENLDTILITGKSLVSEINKTLENLVEKENYSDISYHTCIIRFYKNQPIDTFYGWQWFDYWKKGTTMYLDTSKRLEKLFGQTFHAQWHN